MSEDRETLLIQAKHLWVQLTEDEKRKIMESILIERKNEEEDA